MAGLDAFPQVRRSIFERRDLSAPFEPCAWIATCGVRRAWNGERIWQAYRSHFYQRATDHGFTVIQIVRRVFLVNLVLAALALATVLRPSRELDIAALIAGVMLVAWLLMGFVRGPRIGRRSQNKS